MTDLYELSRPFPPALVERDPKGNAYVAHEVVTQRLLSILGPFDFHVVREIRGDVPTVAPNPQGQSKRAQAGTPALAGAVCGVVVELRCFLDDRWVVVEEIGEVDDVHNWPHDGMRLKVAVSDGLKRCAMRLGCGLSLWAGERYFLDAQLKKRLEAEAAQEPGGEAVSTTPASPPAATDHGADDPAGGDGFSAPALREAQQSPQGSGVGDGDGDGGGEAPAPAAEHQARHAGQARQAGQQQPGQPTLVALCDQAGKPPAWGLLRLLKADRERFLGYGNNALEVFAALQQHGGDNLTEARRILEAAAHEQAKASTRAGAS